MSTTKMKVIDCGDGASNYGAEIVKPGDYYDSLGSVRLVMGKGASRSTALADKKREAWKNGSMAFTVEGLKALGLACLEAAGVETTDVDSLTRASDISFNEGIIRVAAVHGRTVRFRYAKTPTSPIESRAVMPSEVEKHGDTVLFVGQDPDRGGYRSFRLDRIKGDVEVES